MTTLIVQLPPRDPAVPAQEWSLPPLPFVLLDKRGRFVTHFIHESKAETIAQAVDRLL